MQRSSVLGRVSEQSIGIAKSDSEFKKTIGSEFLGILMFPKIAQEHGMHRSSSEQFGVPVDQLRVLRIGIGACSSEFLCAPTWSLE